MSYPRTPNYVLTESFNCTPGSYTSQLLPEGSFVRPIAFDYVPRHITENPKYYHFDSKREVFVYTKFGIVAVPKNILRET